MEQQRQPRQAETEDDEEEESVYVMLELQGLDAMPAPGSTVELKGLDSAAPVLELADGTVLLGTFEETVGTQLVFGDEVSTADGSHAVRLVCHTDKRIVFAKEEAPPAHPVPAVAPARGDGDRGASGGASSENSSGAGEDGSDGMILEQEAAPQEAADGGPSEKQKQQPGVG